MLFGLFNSRQIRKLSDQDLILEIKEGNPKAEGELFIRYSPLVLGLCLKYMKNQMLAEDIMMSLFEKLPNKIERSQIGNLKNWLFTVIRNECLMELRKKKLDTTDIQSSLHFYPDHSQSSLALANERENELKALEAAIDQLKDEQKECIQLFYLKNMSYDQVSEATKYELKKVKSYIQNGKRNLKMILEQGVK